MPHPRWAQGLPISVRPWTTVCWGSQDSLCSLPWDLVSKAESTYGFRAEGQRAPVLLLLSGKAAASLAQLVMLKGMKKGQAVGAEVRMSHILVPGSSHGSTPDHGFLLMRILGGSE